MNTALVIIDMQNDFVQPGAPLAVAGAFETVSAIRKVLLVFRELKWPVLHIVREYLPDGANVEKFRRHSFEQGQKAVLPGTFGARIVTGLEPIDGELKVTKPRFSAFMFTQTDLLLRAKKIEKLVICGTQVPNCVRGTAVDAICYDYDVTLLEDCVSARSPEAKKANLADMEEMGIEVQNSLAWIKNMAKDSIF